MPYVITGEKKLLYLKRFLEKESKSLKILDVGGNKNDLAFIKSLGFNDVTVSNNSRIELEGCGRNAMLFDITKKAAGKNFGIIIFMDVLEHLVSPDKAIVNLNKMLKKSGKLVITTPNLASLPNRLFLLLGWSLPNYSAADIKTGNPLSVAKISTSFRNSFAHKSVFAKKQLIELLELYGFCVIDYRGFTYGATKNVEGGGNFGNIRALIDKITPGAMKEGMFIVCGKKTHVETEKLVKKFI